MKVSGFTFLRNGTLLGYPYIESLKSLLMVCDEVVVAIGAGEDDTLEQVRAIGDARIRIIETTWNEGMRDRGYVYAQQNKLVDLSVLNLSVPKDPSVSHCALCQSGRFYSPDDQVRHELSSRHQEMLKFEQQWQGYLLSNPLLFVN